MPTKRPTTTPQVPGAPLLTIDDAATFLRRSRATVYRLINSGALPTVHPGPGGYTRIRQADLDAYVNSTARSGKSEVA